MQQNMKEALQILHLHFVLFHIWTVSHKLSSLSYYDLSGTTTRELGVVQ